MNFNQLSKTERSFTASSFFDHFIGNSQIASIFILDKTGKILDISKGVERSYGYSSDDLIGENFSIIFTDEDKNAQKPEIELSTVLKKGSASDFNYIVHKNGTLIWTQGESVFVKNEAGEAYVVKNVYDINQEKLLTESLANTEKNQNILSEIFHSVEHGIILFKPLRNKNNDIYDFEYILVNTAAEKLLNKTSVNLIGKKWLEEYPQMKEIGTFDLQVKAIETGIINSTEFYYGFDGFDNWFKNKFIKVGVDLLLVTFDDITEHKQIKAKLEEQVIERTHELLHANEDLKHINEYLDKYAYVISHDLKAPLAAIEGLVPFIKEDYQTMPLDNEGNKMLDMIITKTQDMRNIIEEVLRSAKKEKKVKERVNVYQTVQDIIQTLNPPHHFHILVQYSLPTITYNRIALMQIMQNLIGNSIKFMDKQSPLIQITSTEFNDFYVICVIDNGPGIPDDQLGKIFNPFESGNTKEGIDSHGLGLSIVKQMVEENGGKIWVESELGKETKFHFSILKQ
jgi:PAS domain S-box-containing protein